MNPRSPEPSPHFRYFRGYEHPLAEIPGLVHINEAQCTAAHVLPPHSHPTFEICYIVSGRALWTNPDGSFALGAGDIYLTRPDEPHHGRTDPLDPQRNYAIAFDPHLMTGPTSGKLPQRDLSLASDETRAVDSLGAFDQRVLHGGQGVQRIYRGILDELDALAGADPTRRALIVAMVQALLVELAVFVTRMAIAARERRDATISLPEPRRGDLRVALERLRGSLADPPSLAEMAAWSGLSPGHFAVVFKRELGCTPLEHLTTLRIESAASRLVAEPATAITTIALDLGFCSSQYFSLLFKRAKGRTPREWRSKHGTDDPRD